jgi:hypothetical protein
MPYGQVGHGRSNVWTHGADDGAVLDDVMGDAFLPGRCGELNQGAGVRPDPPVAAVDLVGVDVDVDRVADDPTVLLDPQGSVSLAPGSSPRSRTRCLASQNRACRSLAESEGWLLVQP